jgi:uncharacterized protein
MATKDNGLTAADVLRLYHEEELPEFCEMELTDVNCVGNFGDRPIHVAVWCGNIGEIRALIYGGADVNALGEMGYTPLHAAISTGDIEIVKLLIENGALLNSINDDGRTPLDIANLTGRKDLAKYINNLT